MSNNSIPECLRRKPLDSKSERFLAALKKSAQTTNHVKGTEDSKEPLDKDIKNTISVTTSQRWNTGWELGPETRRMSRAKDRDTEYAEKYKKEFMGIKDKASFKLTGEEEQHAFNGSVDEEERPTTAKCVEQGLDYYITASEGAPSISDIEGVSTIAAPRESVHQEFENPSVEISQIIEEFFSDTHWRNKTRQELPVNNEKRKILGAIEAYPVVVIQGNTGCGKTTQVPQFILEDAITSKKQPVSIYCTQPRKIAARSVAQRVCEENNWQLGTLVGYQVGLDKVASEKTMLTYCTTGVLLEKIITEKSLKSYSHIIVDEVHERDVDTDILLMLIRWYMKKEATFFHLIIMSATMDTEKLKTYFNFRTDYGFQTIIRPFLIKINTYNPQTNHVFYLDCLGSWDKEETLGRRPTFDMDEPEYKEYCINAAVYLVNYVIPKIEGQEKKLAVLIFVPGLGEINRLEIMLRRASSDFDILPLHSSLPNHEQLRVFDPPMSGKRKVILSTNIAESSLTLPDIAYVIDFCLTKSMIKDQRTRYPMLQLQWTSKDRCTQRAGRAGRVMPGKVFRLVPEYFYVHQFPDYGEPELLSAPLEHTVLRTKKASIAPPIEQLGLMLDPPPQREIRAAIIELKQIGALTVRIDGKLDREDGDITELGLVICQLPIDVHLSKLIVMGFIFDCLDDTIIIAACLTCRSIIRSSHHDELGNFRKRISWSRGSFSDLFVNLEAYKEYRQYKELGKNRQFLRKWCDNENLDLKKLEEVEILYYELSRRLSNLNIVVMEQPNRKRDIDQDELMLKFAFCAAFYPNFFTSQQVDRDLVTRMLHESEPSRSVYLENIPQDQGPIYKNQIVRQLEAISDNLDIVFSGSRAVITFNDCDAPLGLVDWEGSKKRPKGFVHESVYLAVKYGDAYGISIREFMPREARLRLEYYEKKLKAEREKSRSLTSTRIKLVENNQPIKPKRVNWVPVSCNSFYIRVTNIVECCHFYGRLDDNRVSQYEDDLTELLADTIFERAIDTCPLEHMVGKMAFATHPKFSGKLRPMARSILQGFHRIEIRSVPHPQTRKLQVFFYDFGLTSIIHESDIHIIANDLRDDNERIERICSVPILAIECKIHGIKPSSWSTTWGGWSDNAAIDFKNKLLNSGLDRRFEAKVFSHCDNIVKLDLIDLSIRDNLCDATSIRQRLITRGEGVGAEESCVSVRDNKIRTNYVPRQEEQDEDIAELVGAFCEIERNAQHDQLDSEELKRLEKNSNGCPEPRALRRRFVESEESIQDESGSLFRSAYTELRGPGSPILLSFVGLSAKSSRMSIRVERESVNSVVLDTDYLDDRNHLLVAASITMSKAGKIMARDTTLLPKIHGLSSIISLLFAPNYEFKINPRLNCLSGAMFGLGGLETGESIDPDNDLEINFECFITKSDVDDINLCRGAMTELISKLNIENCGKPIGQLQQGVRNSIINLIKKRRLPLVEYVQGGALPSWSVDDGETDRSPPNVYASSHKFLPAIRAPSVADSHVYDKIRRNLTYIDEIAEKRQRMTMAGVTCLLCGRGAYVSLVELKEHLETEKHKLRVQEFQAFEQFERNRLSQD